MKKNYILLSLVSVLALTGCGNKTLKCTMSDDSVGMELTSGIEFVFKGDKVNKMTATMDITIPDEYQDKKAELIENYKESATEGMEVSETKDGVRLTMTGNEDKLSEMGIDDKDISYEDLKQALTDEGYTCK